MHLARLLHFINGCLPLAHIVYLAWFVYRLVVRVSDLGLHAAGRLGDDHRRSFLFKLDIDRVFLKECLNGAAPVVKNIPHRV